MPLVGFIVGIVEMQHGWSVYNSREDTGRVTSYPLSRRVRCNQIITLLKLLKLFERFIELAVRDKGFRLIVISFVRALQKVPQLLYSLRSFFFIHRSW